MWLFLVGFLTLPLGWDARVRTALGPDRLVLKTQVVLPDTALRWVLHLPPARFDPALRVNGTSVPLPGDDFLPRKVELTPYIHPGTNTLQLTLHSWTSRLVRPPAWLRDAKDWIEVRRRVKNQAWAPIGGRFYQFGIYGKAFLSGYPGPYVRNLQVWTHYPDSLVVVVELSDSAEITGWVKDASGGIHWSFRGNGRRIQRTWVAPDLKPWWPDTPRLYTLEVRAPGETARVAVGWRGFSARDGAFWLNGQKVLLCGTSFWPPGPRQQTPRQIRKTLLRIKALNARIFRTHTQPWDTLWYAMADTLGVLMIPEAALFNDDELYRLDDPRFDAAVRAHHRAMIQTLGRYPSVVMWSLGNELWGRRSRKPKYEQQLGLWLEAARRMDPTRPVFFEGDGDPAGKSDVIGIHYPLPYREYLVGPFSTFYLERPIPVRHWYWPRKTFFWDRRKPLYIGEFLWMPAPTPHAYVPLLGDEAFRANGWAEAKALAWRWQIVAFRHARVSGFTPWSVQGRTFTILDDSPLYRAQQDACRPTRVAFRWFRRSAPGGVLHDTLELFHDNDSRVRLRLVLSTGTRIWWDTTLVFPPFSHWDLPIHLAFPLTSTLRRETLRATLYHEGVPVDVRTLPVDVFPVLREKRASRSTGVRKSRRTTGRKRWETVRLRGSSPWGTFVDRPVALVHPWSPHPLLDLFPGNFLSLWGSKGISAHGMVDPPPSPYILPLWGAGSGRGMKAVALLEAKPNQIVLWYTLDDATPEGQFWLSRMQKALDSLALPQGLTVWPDLGDLWGGISLPYTGNTAWWLRPHPGRLRKMQRLAGYVRRGGRVWVERPTPQEARFLGLTLKHGQTTVIRREHSLARWILREHLMAYGTSRITWRNAPLRPVADGVLKGGISLTDPPAVVVVPEGKGFWVVSTLKSPGEMPALQQAYLDLLRMILWAPDLHPNASIRDRDDRP